MNPTPRDEDALNDLARMAYDQYAIVTGGKNYQGLPMPAYADLGDTIQAAWRAAAGAVARATTTAASNWIPATYVPAGALGGGGCPNTGQRIADCRCSYHRPDLHVSALSPEVLG